MDTYSMCGDLYHQRYAQAPPPGTTTAQAPPPPVTAPAQSPAPVSTPIAPPGVAPSPAPAPAVYYGMHPPPSQGHLSSSAERWNAYSMPGIETQPYSFHPHPVFPYDHCGYGHNPYYQEPFPPAPGYQGPPQAYMPFPPRGSDVTRFRRKKHLLRDQKRKPMKPPQQSFRGGGKYFQQAMGAFNPDPRAFSAPFNGSPMVNDAHVFPFWRNGLTEAPSRSAGKKRRMEGRGDGRPFRNDGKRKGDKWVVTREKGKRKKGVKSAVAENKVDPNVDVKVTEPAEMSESMKVEGAIVTEEQARQAAAWSELQRDARKRVEEFLRPPSKVEDYGKTEKKGKEEAMQGAAGGDSNVECRDRQVEVQNEVGLGASADVQKADAAFCMDSVTPEADHNNAISADNEHALHLHVTEGQQQFATMDVMEANSTGLLQSTSHVDAIRSDVPNSLHCETFISSNENGQHSVTKPEAGSMVKFAPDDHVKDKMPEQEPLVKSADTASNVEKMCQNPSPEDEFKIREQESFDFFTKLLGEDIALKKLYIENCDDGAFECLMCHTKMKKKYSSLVSLVTHASNVLKTKKLPEHRGYSRAVCFLLGWDPCKIPKVPTKTNVSKSVPQMSTPVNKKTATAEHALVNAAEPAAVPDAGCTFVNDAEEQKQGTDPANSSPRGYADDCAPSNAYNKQISIDGVGGPGKGDGFVAEEVGGAATENEEAMDVDVEQEQAAADGVCGEDGAMNGVEQASIDNGEGGSGQDEVSAAVGEL